MRHLWWAGALAFALAAPARPPAADVPAALVRAYFLAEDPLTRAHIASRIASHPDYRPNRLGEWLHRGAPFGAQPPGLQVFSVNVGRGAWRRVFLIVPRNYRPDRAWPLVYALHPSGQSPEEWCRRTERLLGPLARDALIAAPEFEQNYIAADPPFLPEHPAILDAVARRVHVAADRVYAFGYSKGGFAAWYVALYYSDRIAGAVSMAAGFDVTPGDDGFWKLLVANVAHVPVLNSWGENDSNPAPDLGGKRAGTFSDANRRFEQLVRGMGLPIVNAEVAGAAHNNLATPFESVADILSRRREHDPRRIAHVFRHLHQASCYWLEGLSWVGPSWAYPPPALVPAREGETEMRTIARTLEPLLGRLTGTIHGQTIRVTRQHVGDLVVWFGDRTLDWNQPVTLEVDGTLVFTGKLVRDAGVALARARATMDFDSLHFAGIRVDASGRSTVVTSDTVPEPAWKGVSIPSFD